MKVAPLGIATISSKPWEATRNRDERFPGGLARWVDYWWFAKGIFQQNPPKNELIVREASFGISTCQVEIPGAVPVSKYARWDIGPWAIFGVTQKVREW